VRSTSRVHTRGVIDYTAEDFTKDEQRYEVVLDAVGKSSSCPALTKRGVAARDWMYVQRCADAKTAVVGEILARAQGGGSPQSAAP
jgi:hypothetical protein